eukprot:304535-Hanusia_phi.AAC.1
MEESDSPSPGPRVLRSSRVSRKSSFRLGTNTLATRRQHDWAFPRRGTVPGTDAFQVSSHARTMRAKVSSLLADIPSDLSLSWNTASLSQCSKRPPSVLSRRWPRRG